MLPLEICDFQALFGFLSLDDIFRLGTVSKHLCQIVRDACVIKHTNEITSADIKHWCDRTKFPRLETISNLKVTEKMKLTSTKSLVHRWSEWSTIRMSSNTHTRRAFRHILYSCRKVMLLELNIDHRRARDFDAMPSIFRRFVKNNRDHLHCIVMRNIVPRIVVSCLKDLRCLQYLSINGQIGDEAVLDSITKHLPPLVRKLHLTNHYPLALHKPPDFLRHLKKRRFDALTILGCISICGIECTTWRLVNDFCEAVHVETLCIDLLRLDSLHLLIRRKIRRVDANLVGCKKEDLVNLMEVVPQEYRIKVLQCRMNA